MNREDRQLLRQRYMELTLYPDEYSGTDSDRVAELDRIQRQIRGFRYKSIRNFLADVFFDAEHGILQKDLKNEIIRFIRGSRDRIEWEEISTGHQLRVNAEQSPWVSRDIPAEIGGYIAFRTGRNQVRIVRAFEVPNREV